MWTKNGGSAAMGFGGAHFTSYICRVDRDSCCSPYESIVSEVVDGRNGLKFDANLIK